MALSNSWDLTTNRDTIITDAMLYVGAIGEGETPSASALTENARWLNMLMKAWAADGMPVWALDRGYILPVSGTSSISTASHVVTEYVTSLLTAEELGGETSIAIGSTDGMTAADQIGIELDDGTIEWTTIVSIDGATSLTLTVALTSIASIGNRVFVYTASSDRVARPIRIVHANTMNVTDQISIELDIVDRQTYFNLPNRDETGQINILYHDPELGVGTVYFWPRFQDGQDIVEFTFQRPFMDFDSASDNPDCPQEFYLALTIGLAALIGPKYGVDRDTRKQLLAEAEFYKTKALDTVYAEGSMYVQPETRE